MKGCTADRVNQYVSGWRSKGYSDDIPDEVPEVLMRLNLAPSYKSIAYAILKNDVNLLTLGFSPTASDWYSFLKREELFGKAQGKGFTMPLF